MRSRGVPTLLVAAALTVVTACGGGSDKVVRPPGNPTATSPPTTAAPTATATASRVPRHPVASVRPSTGLVEGQSVTVTGSGFSPGLGLVVVQCLDRGTATGSGDCNLSGLQSVQSDSAGRVTTTLKVSKGPFGNPPVLCSRTQRCLVSVTEATLSPTEEADAAISFR